MVMKFVSSWRRKGNKESDISKNILKQNVKCVHPNGHSFYQETEIRNLENYEILRLDFHFSLLKWH